MTGERVGDSANERFLGLIDILGFRSIVSRNSMDEIALRLTKLNQNLRSFARDGAEQEPAKGQIYFVTFSDSILIYSEREGPDGLGDVVRTTSLFILELLMMGFPARGAITKGELFVSGDRRTFFGKGLIRAYELEQGQKWMGAIVDPELLGADIHIRIQLHVMATFGHIRTYDVPWRVNPSPRQHLAVNWPSGINGLTSKNLYANLRELDRNPSEDARAMHHETIAFFECWDQLSRKAPDKHEHARRAIDLYKEAGRWEEQSETWKDLLSRAAGAENAANDG